MAILSLGLGNEDDLCVGILEDMSGFPPLGLGRPPDPPLDGPEGVSLDHQGHLHLLEGPLKECNSYY